MGYLYYFEINGVPIEFTYILTRQRYSIVIPVDINIELEYFQNSLKVAQALYPDMLDYFMALETERKYIPQYRDIPEEYKGYQAELIEGISEQYKKIEEEQEQYKRDRNKRKKTTGYIYLIKSVQKDIVYKIGRTTNIESRIKSFMTTLIDGVELIHKIPSNDTYLAEQFLHQKYDHKKINGEWFSLSEEEVNEICMMTEIMYEE